MIFCWGLFKWKSQNLYKFFRHDSRTMESLWAKFQNFKRFLFYIKNKDLHSKILYTTWWQTVILIPILNSESEFLESEWLNSKWEQQIIFLRKTWHGKIYVRSPLFSVMLLDQAIISASVGYCFKRRKFFG